MALLGLAAIGTYFVPAGVQVETRIAIAALGLLTMIVMFNSIGFWLAFAGFGVIVALQVQHRGLLQKSLHTVEWLRTLRPEPNTAQTMTRRTPQPTRHPSPATPGPQAQ